MPKKDTDSSLLVQVNDRNGIPVAVFVCVDDKELDKLNNAESMKSPVLVNVKHLRLFVGNAVISELSNDVFVPP